MFEVHSDALSDLSRLKDAEAEVFKVRSSLLYFPKLIKFKYIVIHFKFETRHANF